MNQINLIIVEFRMLWTQTTRICNKKLRRNERRDLIEIIYYLKAKGIVKLITIVQLSFGRWLWMCCISSIVFLHTFTFDEAWNNLQSRIMPWIKHTFVNPAKMHLTQNILQFYVIVHVHPVLFKLPSNNRIEQDLNR